MLRPERPILSISPSCLRLAVLRRGTVVNVERVFLDKSIWEEAWNKELRPLDGFLTQLVKACRLQDGAEVDVLFHSDSVRAEAMSFPTSLPQALQAALLSMREATTGKTDFLCTTVAPLQADATKSAKCHVVAAADYNSTIELIVDLITRTQLTARHLIPAKAASLVATTALARTLPSEPRSALVHLGDFTTGIASGSADQLLFARCVDFGYAQLAEAMLRALRGNGSSEAMDRATAYATLFRIGIPSRTQLIDTSRNVPASVVLPSLQSVLQRYIVEIKQSLRFAFSEAELARATIYLTGPGAMLPGLGQTLSAQLDLPVERLETPGATAPSIQPDHASDVSCAAPHIRSLPALRPLSREIQRRHRIVDACYRVGVTAAVAFLGADALMLARQQSSLETAKQEIAPQLDLVTARKVHLHNSGVASFSVNAAATMLATHGGDRTAWKAMLGEISRITPQQITLLEINSLSAADSKRATVINLRGMAKFAESDDPLSQYIETLSASPLFESVKLVSTRTETEVTRSFLIAAYPRTLPFLLPWESAAADRGVSP